MYGHLDVQPAAKSDGWDTEPFVLTEKEWKSQTPIFFFKFPILQWIFKKKIQDKNKYLW